ncbi:DUF6049 family protein [Ruania zhangjianzhongii]|uniref:DUF6049 family protein n=1 Tax=Ruania zhangjianzhongii TaxID=2603206 RepID=UPI0011C91CF8|nr:DUF6049 family protein [Ruania zhangjianzhongii]
MQRTTSLLVACLLVAATVLAGWTPASADDEPSGLDVQITDITPTVLRPGDDWVIRGTVTNTGTEELSDPVIRLRFQTYVPSSRTALAAWNVSGDSLVTTVLVAQPLGSDLRPGQQRSYQITIPPEESPFYPGAAWGPRGIAVEATSGDVQDAERTTVLWYPDAEDSVATTELSVLVPMTATADEWDAASTDGTTLAEATAPRLGRVLQAADTAGVSWAVDPALLEEQPLGAEAAARALDSDNEPAAEPSTAPDPPSSDPTTAPDPATGTAENGSDPANTESSSSSGSPDGEDAGGAPDDADEPSDTTDDTDPATGTDDTGSADPGETSTDQGEATDQGDSPPSTSGPELTGTELITRLASGSGGRDVIALGYGDADPATFQTEAGSDLAQAGMERSRYLFDQHDIHPIERVLWPSRYDLQSLTTFADLDVRSVVLPADSQPATTDVTYTPSGRSVLDTESGDLDTALWDSGLSALFTSDLTPLQIRQDLLAQTAVIARERPTDGRGLLAVAPHDVGTDPEQLQAVTEALAAIDEAPWLQMTNLRSLLGRTDSGEPREPVPAEPTTPASLADAEVAELGSVLSTLEAYVSVTDAPQRYLGTVGPNALAAPSAALASAPATQRRLLDAAAQTSEELRSAIQVESGSSVLLVSAGGDLPISIQSSLPVEATVTVRMVPGDPRLRAEEVVTATLRPNATTTVRIPVTAVSNGNVDVHFDVLTAADGVLLASGDPFSVRVRADWENTGTIIVAAVLIVGFVIGLVRTIRKGRRFETRAATAGGGAVARTGPEAASADEGGSREQRASALNAARAPEEAETEDGGGAPAEKRPPGEDDSGRNVDGGTRPDAAPDPPRKDQP